MTSEPASRNSTPADGNPTTRRPLPRWTVPVVAGTVVVISATVLVFLWAWVNRLGLEGKELATAQLDVVKVVSGIAVGGGGLFALYLAARRQRTQELELAQREDVHALAVQVAENTDKDATARLVTDLYAKAVEQLGSDKAPVRLGGMYALRRLAQDSPGQRQTIVDVLCAYLRMPFTPPGEPPDEQASSDELRVFQLRNEEQQVRLTAQRILATHLTAERPDETSETYWADIDLDLSGATLTNITFSNCTARTASFDRARFLGTADFSWATFTGGVTFRRATLCTDASFIHTSFKGGAIFDGTAFHGKLDFYSSTFSRSASFRDIECAAESRFTQTSFTCEGILSQADFSRAHFRNEAIFALAEFGGHANFHASHFEDKTDFSGAKFTDIASFGNAIYADSVGFNSILGRDGRVSPMSPAWVRLDVHPKVIHRRSWPPGWSVTAVEGNPTHDETGTWGQLVRTIGGTTSRSV